MNIKTIDLNLLKVLRALLETPNVSAAGTGLGLSQPAVSHALKRLRETFNDPLFVRSSRGVIPTARAQELRPVIMRLFHDLESQLEQKVFDPRADEGVFKIKGTDYFEQAILPRFISVFRNEAPKSKLITRSNLGVLPREDLENGECDVAVAGFFGQLPGGFYQQKLFEDKLVGLARTRHPYLKKTGLKEFVKWPQMVISPEGKLEAGMDKLLERQKLSRQVVASLSSFMSSGWVVQDSDLLLAIPSRLALQLAKVLEVTTFELPVEMPSIQVVQVWHERSHQDPRHQWMRKKLFEVCQENKKKGPPK